jgi:nitrate/nitrite transport system ATP-binding protein
VDEALFLSDRILCMTDGPEAGIGDVIEVNFPRPRERKAVMEHPDYYALRERLIEFLEVHAHKRPTPAAGAVSLDSGQGGGPASDGKLPLAANVR